MIVFQSSANADSQNQRMAIPRQARLLSAGEGRGEGESFGTQTFASSSEGELNLRELYSCERQSALNKVGRVSPLTAASASAESSCFLNPLRVCVKIRVYPCPSVVYLPQDLWDARPKKGR